MSYLYFLLRTCACRRCCSCCHVCGVCVSKLDVLHSKCLVLQSREMHVRGHALTGSLMQLEAAAKGCRTQWLGPGCTGRPSVTSYATVASGEKMGDSRLSCSSTKQRETFVILRGGGDVGSERPEIWWSGPVRSCN